MQYWVCGRGGYREGAIPGTAARWVPGGCYTGYPAWYYPAGLHWYCQGPTKPDTAVLRPPRALQAPAEPSAHPGLLALRYALLDQYGRDSIIFILKLVINPECRLKSHMRPIILPISKTGPNVMTLNFQDFHIGQPSPGRNKWSCF